MDFSKAFKAKSSETFPTPSRCLISGQLPGESLLDN